MKTSRPKWRTLRDADWGVVLRCLWLIPAAEASVCWRVPQQWLAPEAETRASSSPEVPMRAADAARWVDAVYRRLPFAPTCLTRSLVLTRVLRSRGVPCRLRVGVRKQDGRLEAHAWVECDGQPLAEARDHRHFAALEPVPAGLEVKSL